MSLLLLERAPAAGELPLLLLLLRHGKAVLRSRVEQAPILLQRPLSVGFVRVLGVTARRLRAQYTCGAAAVLFNTKAAAMIAALPLPLAGCHAMLLRQLECRGSWEVGGGSGMRRAQTLSPSPVP